MTNDMIYQTTDPKLQDPDYDYILHLVPQLGYYTYPTILPPVYSDFSRVSFFQLIEHEIGHFLGLLHPDDTVGLGGIKCSNCYTHNPAWTTDSNKISTFHPAGYQTVMEPLLGPDMRPLSLSGEDDCQFQKLYCNTCFGPTMGSACALSDVSEPVREHKIGRAHV